MFNEFSVKNIVILDFGGHYLYVKEVASSFTKIGAPYVLHDVAVDRALELATPGVARAAAALQT